MERRHINPGYRPEAKHLGLRWHGPAIRPWQEYFLRYSGLRAGSVAEHLASAKRETHKSSQQMLTSRLTFRIARIIALCFFFHSLNFQINRQKLVVGILDVFVEYICVFPKCSY